MDLFDFVNKKVIIRSREFPQFTLIEGVLYNDMFTGNYGYSIESESSRFSFDSNVIKERIGYTLFI